MEERYSVKKSCWGRLQILNPRSLKEGFINNDDDDFVCVRVGAYVLFLKLLKCIYAVITYSVGKLHRIYSFA